MFDYNRYLPLYLREVQEFTALGDAVDPPARQVYEYTVQKYLNQFIQSADIPTLSRWEAIFRMNGSGLHIQERRRRILIKFCLHAPITVKYLKQAIENMLRTACEITVDYPRYHMDVDLFQVPDETILDFLYEEIYTLKPANITMAMRQFEEHHAQTALTAGALLCAHTEMIAQPLQHSERRNVSCFSVAAGAVQTASIQADVRLNAVRENKGLYGAGAAKSFISEIEVGPVQHDEHRKALRFFSGAGAACLCAVRAEPSAQGTKKSGLRYAACGGKSVHVGLAAGPPGGKTTERKISRCFMACAGVQAVQIQIPARR